MNFAQLVTIFGYPIIFFGTFFEGETVLILGGFLAHRGYVELPWVIFLAFLGTLAGDQLYFYIGRWKGIRFIDSRPHWKRKTDRVFNLLHKHQVALIVGFRFIYGIRTVAPFIIGASGIGTARYLVLNIAGAASWAVVIGVLGYFFGQAAEHLIEEVKRYELWFVAGMIIFGALVWVLYWIFSKKPSQNPRRMHLRSWGSKGRLFSGPVFKETAFDWLQVSENFFPSAGAPTIFGI